MQATRFSPISSYSEPDRCQPFRGQGTASLDKVYSSLRLCSCPTGDAHCCMLWSFRSQDWDSQVSPACQCLYRFFRSDCSLIISLAVQPSSPTAFHRNMSSTLAFGKFSPERRNILIVVGGNSLLTGAVCIHYKDIGAGNPWTVCGKCDLGTVRAPGRVCVCHGVIGYIDSVSAINFHTVNLARRN